MIKITKLTINSSDTIIKKQVIVYAELDNEHLSSVIGNLHNLVAVENKQYKIVGSSFRVKYIISQHNVANYDKLHELITDRINSIIADTNHHINLANTRIKVSNKRNNRKLDDDLIEHINPKDYLFIDDFSVKVDDNNNYIIE